MTMLRMFGVVLVLVAAALTGCADKRHADDQASGSPDASAAVAEPPGGYVDIVEEVTPSIVTIKARMGLGSGVVLRSDVVVTNAHVVRDSREATVTLADGQDSPAKVLATDKMTDLAVLRTERTDLPVPKFRTDVPQPGERALAIGSPLGFQHSVTAGIISGLHRDIPGAATQNPSLVDLIQTDASISPGNSGGALLDAAGRVVGINEAYIPPSAGAVSLGFAIPSATVLDVTDQLLTNGTAVHPYLGVSVGRLTPAIRRLAGLDVDAGALVLGVDPDAPAATAGVRRGDVIVKLAGTSVRSVEDLLTALRQTKSGQERPLVFLRGGDRHEVSVTIGATPD
jgi:S1-C subfamily serine protease